MSRPCHLIIVGDELETLCGALLAASLGLQVTVVRRSVHWLGGLSTRGGLSYMDLTPELMSPVFAQILEQAGLKRVALEPSRTNTVLWQALSAAGVTVYSGVDWRLLLGSQGKLHGLENPATGKRWHADVYWDGTPDASLAHAVGLPFKQGLCDIFGDGQSVNALGVSPVFRLAGLSLEALLEFEAQLRAHPETPALLASVFPWKSVSDRAELINRAPFCLEDSDYVDVLNPVIGAWFHQWTFGETLSYDQAPFWIDGANISRLSDGTFGFNGLVGRISDPAQQLALSEERVPIPAAFYQALGQVERFFREVGGLPDVSVIAPPSLYVRQTVNLAAARHVVTGHEVLTGGCADDKAIGSFSYWLDFRGVHPWLAYPQNLPLPKPTFNVNLLPCLPATDQGHDNLVVVGRSAGYSPVAQGTCRIVQHNALLAEAMACALFLTGGNCDAIAGLDPQAIRSVWAKATAALGKLLPPIGGINVLQDRPDLITAPWLLNDEILVNNTYQAL